MRDLQRTRFSLWLAMLLLCGCAGFTQPQSFEDKIYFTQGQVTAAYDSIAEAALSQRITKAEGESLLDSVDQANDAVQTAKSAGDTETALGKLQFAQTLLLGLEARLKEKMQ